MLGRDNSPVGLDSARLNQNDVDTERLNFHSQCIRKRLYRVLRDIVPCSEIHGHTSGDRTDVDDASEATLAHPGQDLLSKRSQSENVHVQLPACLLQRNIFQRPEVSEAGVVDQYIDGARLQETSVNRRLVAHIQA